MAEPRLKQAEVVEATIGRRADDGWRMLHGRRLLGERNLSAIIWNNRGGS
jgi:hypothetical protein